MVPTGIKSGDSSPVSDAVDTSHILERLNGLKECVKELQVYNRSLEARLSATVLAAVKEGLQGSETPELIS